MLQSIVDDSTLADSVRAVACERLGDYYSMQNDTASSAVFFGRAAGLSSTSEIRLKWAASLIGTGENDSALALLEPLAKSKSRVIASQAHFFRGEALRNVKKYPAALKSYSAAMDVGDSCQWFGPALLGKYQTALALDSASLADRLRGELEKRFPKLVETTLTADTPEPDAAFSEEDVPLPAPAARVETDRPIPALPDTAKSRTPDSVRQTAKKGVAFDIPNKETYSLQVGSFVALPNARALIKRLAPDFPEARIVEGQVNAARYYRARIGTFKTSTEAQAFADSRFKGKSIKYKIVKQ